MPFPMMPGEAARPIMGYVRELESKVLKLRADRRRFHAISFWSGFVIGGGIMMLVLRYLH